MNKAIFISAAVLAASTSSFAFDFSNIVNWTGTGANQAALVIDFHDGQANQSFAWGYRWDGTATGEDMVNAIVASDPLLSDTITSYSFGDAIDSITYDGTSFGLGAHTAGGFNGGTNGFWAYYLGSGSSLPTWTSSGAGFGAETLTTSDWNGWSWAADFNMVPPSDPVTAAPQAAPEPAELIPFAAAGLGLILRRRRSKRSA